ncbi:hypothetical protein LINPERPRIM_LOCUS12944 [Linum perenne]
MTSPADPIPGNADVFQRVDPDLKQRKKMVVPIAGHWWNTFPIVQSFSGSEVFLLKQGGGGDDDSFEEETYEGEAAARPSCWNQCCSSR